MSANGEKMRSFQFKCTVVPSACYSENGKNPDFCIDLKDKSFDIDGVSLGEALEEFKYAIDKRYCIEISKTALKRRSKMYRDYKDGRTEECGYVFKGSLDVQFDNEWKKRYVEIWTDVKEFVDVDLD